MRSYVVYPDTTAAVQPTAARICSRQERPGSSQPGTCRFKFNGINVMTVGDFLKLMIFMGIDDLAD